MSAARRRPVTGRRRAAIVLAGALAASPAFAGDRPITDPVTGVALYGYDPVGYFTSARPLFGRDDVELARDGVVWRFGNSGNRAAFAADPTVYAPVFRGHDPVGVTRGIAVEGHPELWAIHRGRLYLFRNEANRARFREQSDMMLDEAAAAWPALARTLAP